MLIMSHYYELSRPQCFRPNRVSNRHKPVLCWTPDAMQFPGKTEDSSRYISSQKRGTHVPKQPSTCSTLDTHMSRDTSAPLSHVGLTVYSSPASGVGERCNDPRKMVTPLNRLQESGHEGTEAENATGGDVEAVGTSTGGGRGRGARSGACSRARGTRAS